MTSKINLRIRILNLVIINLIPIIGVLFYNWSAYNILFVFWLETLIIGIVNIPKIIIYYKKYPKHIIWALFFFLAPFLIMMPFVYMFMYFFLNSEIISVFTSNNTLVVNDSKIFFDFTSIFISNISVSLILFVNEIYKFFSVFIGEDEYKEGRELPASVPSSERVNDPTFEPISRIFVLGILSLIGFLPTLITQSTLPSLILLVVGKIIFDIEVEKYRMEKESKKA